MSADDQTSTMQHAKDAAGQVTDQVRSQSADMMQKAQDTAVKTADQQKSRAAESIGSLADALRQTGQHLQQNNQGMFGSVANQAADRLEQFSNDLQSKSVDDMVADVEDFARRDPGLFLGGAFLVGLLGARFFRSSARGSQNYNTGSTGNYGRSYQRPGYQQSGYSRQERTQYGSGTADEDYTGTYMPEYGSGTTMSDAQSTYGARQPAPQKPATQSTDYPPAADMGNRAFNNPSQTAHPTDYPPATDAGDLPYNNDPDRTNE